MKKFMMIAAAVAAMFISASINAQEPEKVKCAQIEEAGLAKLQVVKLVKETAEIGLKEAKDLVDNAPSVIPNTNGYDAKEFVDALVAAGAKASVVEVEVVVEEAEEEVAEEE